MIAIRAILSLAVLIAGCAPKPDPRVLAPDAAARELDGSYARALERRAREVPYAVVVMAPGVDPVKQDTPNNCWAAVYSMMLSWKHKRPTTMLDAASKLGDEWADRYRGDTGLPTQDYYHREFISAAGLSVEPPANYLPIVYVELMQKHGPLWINTNVQDLNHAKLMVGAVVSHPNKSVLFLFIDPRTGSSLFMSDVEFFHEFESEARRIVDNDLAWAFRYQILHW